MHCVPQAGSAQTHLSAEGPAQCLPGVPLWVESGQEGRKRGCPEESAGYFG